MSWTGLQMISLGSLLLFWGPPLCAEARRCIDLNAILRNSTESPNHKATSEDLRHRSISPWKYRIDKDETRHPPVIQEADCENSGCTINNGEDVNYNSVAVNVMMMVLYRSQCAHNPKKYEVTVGWKLVAVACTCARPKFS